MSLTTLHLIFISTAIALAFGCGLLWMSEFVSGSSGPLGFLSALLALALGGGLIQYERYAAKKFRKLLGFGSHHL